MYVLEQVLRATLCTDSIKFVTDIAKFSICSSAGFSLRCCSLAVFLAFLLCSTLKNARACVCEYKQGFLKLLYNAMGGVRKGMCKF